jgi:hypothetical protein
VARLNRLRILREAAETRAGLTHQKFFVEGLKVLRAVPIDGGN